ncbi:kinase-like domain-containing protein [Mycena olivaceomarginata]|nr:kinase-like domain-containing protein [Mycena olivaceomarginata]
MKTKTDASALPGTKCKGRGGRRAKKKKPGVVDAGENNNSVDLSSEKENLQENLKPIGNGLFVLPNGNSSNPLSPSGLSFSPTIPMLGPSRRALVGYGSHGTVVYRGSLQGRAVAVKGLLQDFVTLASREVSILQESDNHPNLCPPTLADLIETPDRDAWRDIAVAFDPKRALRQIAGGLRHLHGLKLVHRDIKPQNILVSAGAGGGAKAYWMLISEFRLCKKLDVDQTSFLPTSHGAMAARTLDEMGAGDDASVSSQGSAASGASSGTAGKPARLTKSVDIFALGCLFFYTLTNGGHPFGDRFEREANIMKGAKKPARARAIRGRGGGGGGSDILYAAHRSARTSRHDDVSPASFLLGSRPTPNLPENRFEIMTRIPKEPYLLVLERGASAIVGNDWLSRLDPVFLENLGKFWPLVDVARADQRRERQGRRNSRARGGERRHGPESMPRSAIEAMEFAIDRGDEHNIE